MQSQASRVWTTEELILELRGSQRIVDEAVVLFTQAGIVRETDGGIIFDTSTHFRAVIEQCAQNYLERPSTVIKAIVGGQDEKLRAFSDAFKFRRD
jgi:hypothetical protein